tara:strand:+ start:201 stop:518 length:318 start_codon:yes stop_codon:yes gene_type:complete
MEMKEYEYNSKSGFLTRVKITTKQVEHFSISKWDKDWVDSMHLEVILNLDDKWKNIRKLRKNMKADVSQPDTKAFLLKLLEMGLIERRKPNNKHTEFRRIQRRNK